MKIDFRGSTKNPLDNSSGILYNYYIVCLRTCLHKRIHVSFRQIVLHTA